jgi:hypothetical protein
MATSNEGTRELGKKEEYGRRGEMRDNWERMEEEGKAKFRARRCSGWLNTRKLLDIVSFFFSVF